MIKIGQEYRMQTSLGVLQVMVGLGTWLFSAITLRFMDLVPREGDLLAAFVRQTGLVFLLLPFAWAVFTIKKESDPSSTWTTRHTLISGIVLMIVLFYLMAWSASFGRVAPRIVPIGIG